MAAKWTDNELITLAQNLVDGFPVQSMEELIPTRNIGGIKLKAQEFGFGIKTSKIDRRTRFYANIRSRTRDANTSSETDKVNSIVNAIEASQLAQSIPSTATQHSEPKTRIIAYDGFSANELAVNMLQDYGLNANPDIIRYLSIHILGGQL